VVLTTCSPELYLRRPPARNERYRLDNLLKAAAERGVRINVVVYKEVPQALTCE
jgi:phospholipase D1/2